MSIGDVSMLGGQVHPSDVDLQLSERLRKGRGRAEQLSSPGMRAGPDQLRPVRVQQDVLHTAALQVRHDRGLRRRHGRVRLHIPQVSTGGHPLRGADDGSAVAGGPRRQHLRAKGEKVRRLSGLSDGGGRGRVPGDGLPARSVPVRERAALHRHGAQVQPQERLRRQLGRAELQLPAVPRGPVPVCQLAVHPGDVPLRRLPRLLGRE
uniref:(northern house mosquito) hypothetical protein n=1 Tax=Culex pipiens TaxID=7175 RepID=A0A8D8EX02_CULPI